MSLTQFDIASAGRIAEVVRAVEGEPQPAHPLIFDVRLESTRTRNALRLGTFTGDWATNTYKTVTLHGSTNTVSVFNWCNPATGGNTASSTQSRYVIFGSVNGTQSAVEIQLGSTAQTSQTCTLTIGSLDLTQISGYSAGQIQLLGHAAGSSTCAGALTWYSITTCSTAA